MSRLLGRLAGKILKWLLFAVIVLLITLYALVRWAQPETYGLQASQFVDSASPSHGKALDTIVKVKPITSRRPNIVVILADDLGYGDLSSHGSTVVNTPHIDKLAAEGMRFTDFYSAMPVCTPSRAGLLTGRYPPRSGMITAGQAHGDSFMRKVVYKAGQVFSQVGVVDMRGGGNMVDGLPKSEVTIAEMLQVAGYKTGVFGKWHLGDFTVMPEFHPYEHGFDEFAGFNMSNDDWPVAYWVGREEKVKDIGLKQSEYTKIFTQTAIQFIEKHKDQPFFVYLAQKDPHQPFYPSDAYKGKSKGGPYGDAVEEFDGSVGEVHRALKRLGLDKNTLVMVTSDNGPWYEGSAGGLRGRKGQTYEGGFRVPMVAWWPGVIPPGKINGTPAMNIDVLPTVADVASVELPTDRVIDGVSLMPTLKGGELGVQRPLFFFDDYDVEGIRQGD